MKPPLVSVVIAAYQRSNVLRCAIESVRAQTFRDWDLWVVGDACTDDSEAVTRSFDDPRIHWVNLPENVGEQSGPNREGTRLSRGRYLAYLNQDDLWLPEHLERAIETLESREADWVFTIMSSLRIGQPNRPTSVSRSGGYDPGITFAPASSWLLRREVLDEVGPWRDFRQCHLVPTQDLLFRAWKAGKKIRQVPHVTAVFVGSLTLKRQYTERRDELNREHLERMRSDPRYREREIESALVGLQRRVARPSPWTRVCLALGIHPTSVRNFRRFRRRGGRVDQLRARRGLPPVTRTHPPQGVTP